MLTVHRAADRFRTEQPGIVTYHSFSSGAHYDPDNLSFGPLIACDEHFLEPGAGFDTHPHARLELLSWVVDGTLQHEDDSGRVQHCGPGQVQYQCTGSGIRHAERNASDTEPLHFVQFWLLTEEELPAYQVGLAPVNVSTGRFYAASPERSSTYPPAPTYHLFVASGEWKLGLDSLRPGDSARLQREFFHLTGAGELIVFQCDLNADGHRVAERPVERG